MKHKTVDLKTEIKRASLPSGLEGFLFPIFEAISNSLHSIEDRFAETLEVDGEIKVSFSSDNKTIEVCDNGEGFNKKNLNAFLTPFTGNKLKRKGKGFGRFISFKIFDEVYYASPTILPENDDYTSEIFSYLPFSENDNLIPQTDEKCYQKHPYEKGLSVLFKKPKEDFIKFFNFDETQEQKDYSEENIIMCILDHFLIEFIQNKIPRKFTFEINSTLFNLSEYFEDSVKHCDKKQLDLTINNQNYNFNFDYMKIQASKSKKHNLYFYADNRATGELENISKGLSDKAFEDQKGDKYFYLVAVSSEFFKASQTRDSIENLNVKIDIEGKRESLKNIILKAAKSNILDLEPSYTNQRRSTMRKHVEEILVFDPILRSGLGNNSIDEFVQKRGITESKEQIASDLFISRQRNKFDFNKIHSETSFDELKNIVKDKIPTDAKEALAIYVAYRSNVLNIFSKMLAKTNLINTKEDTVHSLIYPRYKDSEEVDYSSHNLWIIDDDLAHAEYISSDRTIVGKKRPKGLFAHDILINSQNELLIIEMKRPHKDKYDNDEDVTKLTDNPIQQLIEQVDQIREKGFILTSSERRIEIPSDHMVRCYILTDWNEKLEKYMRTNDYITTNFGGLMAYRYYREINMMIEVLAFDRLLDRAGKRNEIFKNILEGKSNYEGKKNGSVI